MVSMSSIVLWSLKVFNCLAVLKGLDVSIGFKVFISIKVQNVHKVFKIPKSLELFGYDIDMT